MARRNDRLAETIIRLAQANPSKLVVLDRRTHPAAWKAWEQFYRQNGLEDWAGAKAMGERITVLAEFPPGDAANITEVFS